MIFLSEKEPEDINLVSQSEINLQYN
jgi:hypothetical protein